MRISSNALLRAVAPGHHGVTRRDRSLRAIAGVAVSIALGARPTAGAPTPDPPEPDPAPEPPERR